MGPQHLLSPGPRRTRSGRAGLLVAPLALGLLAACGEPAGSGDEPSAQETRPRSDEAAGAEAAAELSSGKRGPGSASDELGTLPGERPLADPLFADKYARSSAANDDWDTELLSEGINAALVPLKKWLTHEPGERPSLAGVATADWRSTRLRPAQLDTTRTGPAFRVLRAPDSALEEPAGPGHLEALLRDSLAAFGGAPARRIKFKLVGVARDGTRASTRIFFHATGPGAPDDDGSSDTGDVQINAIWEVVFDTAESGDTGTPLLSELVVTRYEEVHARRAAAFEDITEAVLGGNASYREQLSVGLDSWAGRIDAALGMSLIGHEGLALGDANGDGLDDLYVCQPAGLPNLLFVRGADGKAEDWSAQAGVDFLDGSRSALFLDLDGDGDQDLVVEADPVLLVLENDGSAHFELRAELPAPATTSLAAADYDGDGDLDLYACGYMLPDSEHRTPIPYHDANNGRPNKLLRNDLPPVDASGDASGAALPPEAWSFSDVTRAVGLDRNNRRYSFSAAWEDYDDDGDPDLYVANDFGRNNLYRNDGGEFVDVAAEAGVEDISAGMGVTWSDLDRDGRMDLYVSNMFSSAGGRIAYQRRFHEGDSQAARDQYQRHARGNTLFRNLGDGQFADVSERAGTTMGRWAWGSIALDLQNDGWPELFIPNGFVTGSDPADL